MSLKSDRKVDGGKDKVLEDGVKKKKVSEGSGDDYEQGMMEMSCEDVEGCCDRGEGFIGVSKR